MPAVRCSPADVVDGAGRATRELAETPARALFDRPARFPEALLVEVFGQELLGLRGTQRAGAGRTDPGAGSVVFGVEGEGERCDRDHHRVAGADLGELLRSRSAGARERDDQLVVSQGVLLRTHDEVIEG